MVRQGRTIRSGNQPGMHCLHWEEGSGDWATWNRPLATVGCRREEVCVHPGLLSVCLREWGDHTLGQVWKIRPLWAISLKGPVQEAIRSVKPAIMFTLSIRRSF